MNVLCCALRGGTTAAPISIMCPHSTWRPGCDSHAAPFALRIRLLHVVTRIGAQGAAECRANKEQTQTSGRTIESENKSTRALSKGRSCRKQGYEYRAQWGRAVHRRHFKDGPRVGQVSQGESKEQRQSGAHGQGRPTSAQRQAHSGRGWCQGQPVI